MANIREIHDRMNSIRDTMKITNAMYLISSTKLRRARKNLEETQEYFFTLQDMMDHVLRNMAEAKSEYFDLRPGKEKEEHIRGIIVVTADKGLAGAYNHNVLKLAQEQIAQHKNCKLFVVGDVGRHFFARRETPIAEHFHYTAQNPSLHRARIISEMVLEQFRSGELDEVYIIYTGMKNSVTTKTYVRQLLPLARNEETGENGDPKEPPVFQPDPETVLKNIVPDCVMGYVYGALVESFCSEQNARMMAMEAASKNAAVIIHDLSIEYNRVRQNMITQEITEVIAGLKAQKRKKKLNTGKS